MTAPYLSCGFIEKSLTFTATALYHCCISLHSTAGWARITDFAGGRLPIETIKRSRSDLRNTLERGEAQSCTGCSAFLQHRNWDDDSGYMFNSLVLNHYTVCNLRCSYCCWLTSHPLPFGLSPYPIFPILQEIVNEEWLAPGGLIAWGGGEPVLCPDFSESLEFMMKHGFVHEIYSNATLFSPAVYNYLGGSELKLMVSVDAGTRETYRQMKQADGWSAVWENLGKYAEQGAGNLTVKYIVTAENCSENEWRPFIEKVERLPAEISVAIDVSHSGPEVDSEIIDAMVEMESECLRKGLSVTAGVHGAHSLPQQHILERMETSRSLNRFE